MRSILRTIVAAWMAIVFAAVSHAEVSFDLGDAFGEPGQTVLVPWSYTGNGQATSISARFDFSNTFINAVDFTQCLEDFSESHHYSDCFDQDGTGDNVSFFILDLNSDPLDSGGGYIAFTIDSSAWDGEIIDLEWQTDSMEVDGDPVVNTTNGQIHVFEDPAVQNATISGTITDADIGSPIEGAYVRIGDQDLANSSGNLSSSLIGFATTDLDGNYLVEVPMSEGNRSIVIEAGSPDHVPGRVGGAPPLLNGLAPDLCFFNCLGGSGIIEISPGDTLTNQDLTLSRGGSASGAITRASDGGPVEAAGIWVFHESAGRIGYATAFSDGSGFYQLPFALPNGDYFFLALPPFGENFVAQAWQDIECEHRSCRIHDADPVSVDVNTPASGVNFELQKGASIAGTLEPSSTEGRVWLFSASGFPLTSQSVGSGDTQWQLDGLSGGSYYALFQPDGGPEPYVSAIHNGVACPFGLPLPGCNPARGMPLQVERGSELSGLQVELESGGMVQGSIVDADSGQTPTVNTGSFQNFEVIDSQGKVVGGGRIEADGGQLLLTPVSGIPPGNYFLRTYSRWMGKGIGYTHPSSVDNGMVPGYMDAVSDGLSGGRPCAGLKCDLDGLTPFTIVDGQTTNIVLEISTGSLIQGSIVDDTNDNPMSWALVKLLDVNNRLLATTLADVNGQFSFGGFPAGSYYLRTAMSNHVGNSTGQILSAFGLSQRSYFDRLHGAVSDCSEARCEPADGQAIVLDGVNPAGPIDLRVTPGPVIKGQLIDADTGRAIRRGRVDVFDSDGVYVGEFRVNPLTGMYQTTALSPGTYFLSPSVSPAFRTVTGTGSATEGGQNSGSSGGLTRTSGDNFPVVIGSSSATADFRLIDTADDDIFRSDFELID